MANQPLIERVERLLRTRVESSHAVAGGYTPATRLVCRTPRGTVFVKAGATPLTSRFVNREIRVYGRIRGEFMPRLIAWEEHDSEPLLILEDLTTAAWPPPWSRDRIEQVLAAVGSMNAFPASELEPFSEVFGGVKLGWHAVAEDPPSFLSLGLVTRAWLDAALPALLGAEERCPTEGDCLTHWDLRSDNLCFASRGAVLVDWNLSCRANPQLDLGFWLPSLVAEGGPLPETILPNAPEVAAWVSGFFATRAGLPVIPDAPRVRWVQKQQLDSALPWAIRALGLPPAGEA